MWVVSKMHLMLDDACFQRVAGSKMYSMRNHPEIRMLEELCTMKVELLVEDVLEKSVVAG